MVSGTRPVGYGVSKGPASVRVGGDGDTSLDRIQNSRAGQAGRTPIPQGKRDMTMFSETRSTRLQARFKLLMGLGIAAAMAFPAAAEAQYFGRNKVQYDDFEFKVLSTPHFNIHYYPLSDAAIEDLARQSERWYERFARAFQHEFEAPKPLIIYADHPDFQQTNTLQGTIGQGTGGVTESLKNRVILPLTGSYWDTDHVLGHELVHAFQYNIAQSRRGGGLQGLVTLPLWLVEGMAEYLSVGRDDPLTAMWMRDAILRDDFPTITQLTRDSRFFPYRFGQALWAYVGGTYGDDAIIDVYRRSLRIGFAPAIQQVLGVPMDTLSAQWKASVSDAYLPLMEGRAAPEDAGRPILNSDNSGDQNFAPALSPDGRYIAYLSEKDVFAVDLYIADATTGRVVRKLVSAVTDPHGDALRYIDSSGSWSPDGSQFAFVVFAEGDNQIVIVDTDDGDFDRRLTFEDDQIGAINNPAWSPDGGRIAFSGMVGGISDLFVYDLESEQLDRLTNDKFADMHPTWSPDGTQLAFASDRGPETDWDALVYSKFQIATIDISTRAVRVLNLLGNVRHSNPQYAPNGQQLYFLSDADGFSDVYRTDLRGRSIERITRVVTGVSGIVAMSPALSVAAGTGELAISIFDEAGYRINGFSADAPGTPVRVVAATDDEMMAGRIIPPADRERYSRVAEYLADPGTGLAMPRTYTVGQSAEYDPSLALDFVGQPSLGVGADQFGSFIGGGASAFFSDMLGNQTVGVAISAQGRIKDIGGQVFYLDTGDRWNWAVAAGRVPYQFLRQGFGQEVVITDTDTIIGDPFLAQQRYRIYNSSLLGQVSYPFSSTQRIEFGVGASRISYDVEEDRFFLDQFGRVTRVDRVSRDDLEPPALNLANASVALVGDNSFSAFTSPIRGGRYRFELEATVGSIDFVTATADWRRYWAPHKNLTVAFRGLHFGRYGNLDSNAIQPLFLGFETFIRGYAFESFQNGECAASVDPNTPILNNQGQISTCPVFDRLFGQRLGVMNLEVRIPVIGVEQFGLINFPFLPTELVGFVDGGIAWDADASPVWKFSRSSAERVPVFSAGIAARTSVLGILILETYYAFPFQRPDRGAHWGFNLAPGW